MWTSMPVSQFLSVDDLYIIMFDTRASAISQHPWLSCPLLIVTAAHLSRVTGAELINLLILLALNFEVGGSPFGLFSIRASPLDVARTLTFTSRMTLLGVSHRLCSVDLRSFNGVSVSSVPTLPDIYTLEVNARKQRPSSSSTTPKASTMN